jgi:predicted ribosomally synthesized six-cysteine peptide SCIFF
LKHIITIYTGQTSTKSGACGQCATSCQSACKTSCTVGNQVCVNQG